MEEFKTKIGVKQGYVMSLILFFSVINDSIKEATRKMKRKIMLLEIGTNYIDTADICGYDGGLEEFVKQFEHTEPRTNKKIISHQQKMYDNSQRIKRTEIKRRNNRIKYPGTKMEANRKIIKLTKR